MRIKIFDTEDIMSDGTAEVWAMREGSELNDRYHCTCIYEMLAAKQLFDIIMVVNEIEIEEEIFYKYCLENNL